jgi:PRTRC genetic system ThiF family protein
MNNPASDFKPTMHFTAPYLLQPTNPITVNLIGAGGTGSHVVTALARMNHSLLELGHPGFLVYLWDADVVSKANLGRQLFAEIEVGTNKAVALINRVNRFFGTNWKAIPCFYNSKQVHQFARKDKDASTNLLISCVDTVPARFEIAKLLNTFNSANQYRSNKPFYWLDFGNSQHTGQVILSTASAIQQPVSNLFRTVDTLPYVTEEFRELLEQSAESDNTPSCSLAEALTKQDLYINPTLANMGCSLLWNLFRTGMTEYRGFFVHIKDFRAQPLKVG